LNHPHRIPQGSLAARLTGTARRREALRSVIAIAMILASTLGGIAVVGASGLGGSHKTLIATAAP
jgi:hypothetical protein